MNKRLAFLEQTTRAGTADSFAWYALGLEYRKEQRVDEALATFRSLRERDARYLAVYLMAAQTCVEAARGGEAKEWLDAGILLARELGDGKALGELESLLGELQDG